ncbi:tyrosine-type recombinase/integrase [uncultured Lamprocystis sp.]|uniref:tyrosine-type recombinase/integrase n=1 Tax=uncultured Lamprocystis sp. TaxID=543132 RepID=UPI00345DCF3B
MSGQDGLTTHPASPSGRNLDRGQRGGGICNTCGSFSDSVGSRGFHRQRTRYDAVTDPLLWSVDETARQLGNISRRTVERLLATGKLRPVKIGRRRMVDPKSARALVTNNALGDTSSGAAVLEITPCQKPESATKTVSSSGRTRRTGGPRRPTDSADRLAAVLNHESREALISRARFRSTWCPGSSWVFARKDGTRIVSVKVGFASCVKSAGLADIHPHDLRRTFGSWLVQAGVGIDRVSKLLRHGDVAITARVYAHLRPSDLSEAVAVLDRTGPTVSRSGFTFADSSLNRDS